MSQKLPFQTTVLLPGPMPVSSVAHAKNVRVFSHQSLLKPEWPRTKSCPLLLLKSALCCPSLFITTSNAFLGLSPLSWAAPSPGPSPGPLAHLDAHLGPCSPRLSPRPLLTWMLTWALAHLDAHLGPHLGPCSPGLLTASRLALLQCVFYNTNRMIH